MTDRIVLIYLDDLIIPSESEEEDVLKLKLVLETASKFRLELNLKNCHFLKRKIEYLEQGTIKPSPAKTTAVQNFPRAKRH